MFLPAIFQIGLGLPTGQVDFVKLILEQIFRISPSLLSQYSLLQDKLLWLILVPHIVVFMFIFSFAVWIIPKHAGLRRLLAIATYLVLILGGYYGSFIVPLVNTWFMILLISGFIFFLVSRIFPPKSLDAVTGLLGEAVGLATKKPKERRQLEEDIRALDKTIKDLSVDANNAPAGDRKELYGMIAKLKSEKYQKQKDLEKLERGG